MTVGSAVTPCIFSGSALVTVAALQTLNIRAVCAQGGSATITGAGTLAIDTGAFEWSSGTWSTAVTTVASALTISGNVTAANSVGLPG